MHERPKCVVCQVAKEFAGKGQTPPRDKKEKKIGGETVLPLQFTFLVWEPIIQVVRGPRGRGGAKASVVLI